MTQKGKNEGESRQGKGLTLSCGDTGVLGWGKGAAQETSKNLLSLQGTFLSPTPTVCIQHQAPDPGDGWTPGFSVTEEMGNVGTLNSIRNVLTTVIIMGPTKEAGTVTKTLPETPDVRRHFPFQVTSPSSSCSPHPTWSRNRDGHCNLLTIPPTVPPGGTKE